MQYDFDKEVPRRGTYASKWEVMQDEHNPQRLKQTDAFYGENRVLPLWVADMDFACPEPVIEALVARAHQGVYGYTYPPDSYFDAVVGWMQRRHGWTISPEWICLTPGVVSALNMLVRTFVAPGEKVLVQPPVYYPFYSAIQNNGGEVVANPLIYEDGRYRMDFDHLEEVAKDPRLRMAILCSPHNPVGRVWSAEELHRFGEICLRNNVLVIADEVHGDLIYRSATFTPFASLGADFSERAITCSAPSKTFNMAGLKTSNIIIANADLRARFEKTLQSNGLHGISAFGVVAAEAAYTAGEEWLRQVLDYIEGNLRYVQAYLAEHLYEISVVPPEGTYLLWLDCRRLGLDQAGLKRLFLHEARVYLEDGSIFGAEGAGFQRMNIACPRSILSEALDRIAAALRRD
jgi:cystathionine beta-lyase